MQGCFLTQWKRLETIFKIMADKRDFGFELDLHPRQEAVQTIKQVDNLFVHIKGNMSREIQYIRL